MPCIRVLGSVSAYMYKTILCMQSMYAAYVCVCMNMYAMTSTIHRCKKSTHQSTVSIYVSNLPWIQTIGKKVQERVGVEGRDREDT